MRFSPVIFMTMRIAVDDVELGGVTIPAGTFIIANTAAANHDPAVHDEPDRFDITREGAPAMLSPSAAASTTASVRTWRESSSQRPSRPWPVGCPTYGAPGAARWKPLTGITGPIGLPVEFDCGY